MNRTALCLAAAMLAFTVGFAQPPAIKLDIGAVLKAKYVPKKPDYITVGCSFWPSVEQEVKGVKYRIAYDEKTRRIIYLSTTDKDFKTADGRRVGQVIRVTKNQVQHYGGTGAALYAPPTIDGWYPWVGSNFDITDTEGTEVSLNPLKNIGAAESVEVEILGFDKWE